MHVSLGAVLQVAGIKTGHDSIEVLRGGFPSYVVRVKPPAFSRKPTVIVKACVGASREPDVLLHLHRAGFPVPAVLDIRQGDGFRVVLEDAGTDTLCKRADPEWYMRAVREIAGMHGASVPPTKLGGSGKALTGMLPTYDVSRWLSVVRSGLDGTVRRLKDGTYTGFDAPWGRQGRHVLESVAEKSLEMIAGWEGPGGPANPEARWSLPPSLVHGDYRDGNILIRPAQARVAGERAGGWVTALAAPEEAARELVIIDWDSARWDSGFFDLVSLYDVSERMGTCRLDPEQLIDTYLRTRWAEDTRLTRGIVHSEWHRCCILRAWDELRWFSETGED
ncbi:MAG TPA: hypothetical protein DCM14_04460, partial [Clostridiales bacterium UBA8153]|nr:hypothetical protein [Clostridiales bacterium UBA8153]